MKALPDLGLPTGVEAFDGSLETGFSWRSKDGGDAQAQTQADYPSQSITELVSTLKTSVVIELGIGWQAEDLPVLDHGLDRRASKDSAIWPRSNQTSVQRYGVKNFNVDSTFDDQALDHIETIEFMTPLCHLRQIPAGRRWSMTSTMPTIQSSAPLQNPPNRAYSRDLDLASNKQFSLDRLCPVFSQYAFVFEVGAYSNNQVLDASFSSTDTAGAVRAILPVDTSKSFPLGSFIPVMDGGDANMKSPRDCSQRFTLTHGSYHRFTSFKRRNF
jgi:hypothetical protein